MLPAVWGRLEDLHAARRLAKAERRWLAPGRPVWPTYVAALAVGAVVLGLLVVRAPGEPVLTGPTVSTTTTTPVEVDAAIAERPAEDPAPTTGDADPVTPASSPPATAEVPTVTAAPPSAPPPTAAPGTTTTTAPADPDQPGKAWGHEMGTGNGGTPPGHERPRGK